MPKLCRQTNGVMFISIPRSLVNAKSLMKGTRMNWKLDGIGRLVLEADKI